MKRILGLDIGTASIGWAVVNEAEKNNERSSIVSTGVRIVQYDNFVNTSTGSESKDPERDFASGKGISPNAGRTQKRGARRNLQRYKLRRENLIAILKENGIISDDTVLYEQGNASTFQTYRLRAKAVTEEISLEELARVLLMINKKRGYKSSRKVKSDEDGQLIDGMAVAKMLYDEELTPGELTLRFLRAGKKEPEFYRSDLQAEFNDIWRCQQNYYGHILTDELLEKVTGKNRGQTWSILKEPLGADGIKQEGSRNEAKIERYIWRVEALSQKIGLEELVLVLQDINAQISGSSGYLGDITDRSKELYFNKQTVGQYLMSQLDKDPNTSLKNRVFYRQDYLNEFNAVWERQASFHPELTDELKHKIRDVVIFYQRRLKSQKGLISFCEFESRKIEIKDEFGRTKTKTRGLRVAPRSSPLFQEFKTWQILNNVEVFGKGNRKGTKKAEDGLLETGSRVLSEEEKRILAEELSIKDKMSKGDVLKLLFSNHKELDLNFDKIEGNKTQAALFGAYAKIIEDSGHGEHDFPKMRYGDAINLVSSVFSTLGYNTNILYYDSDTAPDSDAMYGLWHLLYSFEGDDSTSGNDKLIAKLGERYGFSRNHAAFIANVTFTDDYASLSAKAMGKILPHMKDGNKYDVACAYAGYRHSKSSLTKEEIENKILSDTLKLLPKNSLRNPVVEKILNQMINLINELVYEYSAKDGNGKIIEFWRPNEVRIELARELKKNAKQREKMSDAINRTTKENELIAKKIEADFGFKYVSRNDIIRYKLYKELEPNGYKTLYSDTLISYQDLFSKEFDIEHIIPKALLFDDSQSNKTLELRDVNIRKGNMTANDYIRNKYGEQGYNAYIEKIETLFSSDPSKKTKLKKLKMSSAELPQDFIARDINDTQYIARKAKEILEKWVRSVVSTTGSITARLREDWQLTDMMMELNWEKYKHIPDMTYYEVNRDGRRLRRIKDWTKRNDHRHHAMDAITVAFTKRAYIQYLNNLSARSDKSSITCAIEQKELERDRNNKLKFRAPILVEEFRAEAKRHIESILISFKANNKVMTLNINKTKKGKGGTHEEPQLTPRGPLHNETIYGSIRRPAEKRAKINASFNVERVMSVCDANHREALLTRLAEFGGDPKKAFTGKNALSKNPLYDKNNTRVPEEIKVFETVYTIRKPVSPDLNVAKVIDKRIRAILENRLEEFGGSSKEAFSNLDENPIWLNKNRGIAIKSVTIEGIKTGECLRYKRNRKGEFVYDEQGRRQPVDFVNTGNNHHVAIYRDGNGELHEKVVSLYEAVARASEGLPAVNKEYKADEGLELLFTMKRNECFVFPNPKTGFDPSEIDLTDPANYALISPNLFRVQKLANKDYFFRHHLETTVNSIKELQNITWIRKRSFEGMDKIVKVRINHIGKIVAVGEY